MKTMNNNIGNGQSNQLATQKKNNHGNNHNEVQRGRQGLHD